MSDTKENILAIAESLVLRQGFAGTSIDSIIESTGISKGAFFYHFKNKDELAKALVERYAHRDHELFEQFSKRSEELSDDPLQSMLIYLKLFEEFIEGLDEPFAGCVYALYTYEQDSLEPGIMNYVTDNLRVWQQGYVEKLEKIVEKYPPKTKVNVNELAEVIMGIVQGGIILSKAFDDQKMLVRQSKHFRQYLQLLFS